MIKPKYIDLVKTRVDLAHLVSVLCPDIKQIKSGSNRTKCCCPFHREKTPSFMMDLTMNRYHCFGCGKSGDVISFVRDFMGLDFEGAVRSLLEMYCDDIDQNNLFEKSTPEREDEVRKKESMFIYNGYAQEFFTEKYLEETEEAIACRSYAEQADTSFCEGRWDRAFCRTYGLGYAPLRGNQFLTFAREKGLNINILLELGLLAEDEHHPGNYYDFYRGRLMIPQRDRYGRIITFTARSLDSQASQKYLNGKESFIYQKKISIFGIDVALKSARQLGKVYLVEGAPDVLRLQSIGIANVVAPLGGSWHEEQLQVFSRFGCRLCFIPDCDVVKEGEQYGTGEKFVFQNGRLAVEMGFQTSVREIPRKTGTKQDPDSFITSQACLDSLPETDFILWYADKHYRFEASNDAQLEVISDVCDLLVHVPSEVLRQSLLNELRDKYSRASIWKSALSDASRRLQERKRRQAIRKSDGMEGFQFYIRNCHYYDIDAQGREREWTNFIIRPLFLITDDAQPTRIFEIENDNGEKKTVELSQSDVTKLERFKERIEGKGNYRFFEKPEKYELLKAYMYEKTASAQRVTQMGWNEAGKKGFYAFCNGIVYEGKWKSVNEYGIIKLDEENFYLPAMSKIHMQNRKGFVNERRFMHEPKVSVDMRYYFSLMVDCYGNNAIIAICYYLATLFRDIIIDSTRSFPLLNIYGQKEAGKTEFALCLMYLFKRNIDVDNLESTTYYAMGDICAEVSNMLVHFDEFKNSLSRKHIDFLKGVYDSAGRTKRAADGERRESTNVDCGVILTGQEMPTVDIALFSRLIFLETHKNKHSKEETDRFHELLRLRNLHPTNITVGLMKYRENFHAGWRHAWSRALSETKTYVNYNVVGERFINNWSMMLATYYTLAPFIGGDLPFCEEKVRKTCIDGLKYQHSLCSTTDEIAVFWSMFSKCRQLGNIREGQDYKISKIKTIKVSTKREPVKTVSFDQPTDILFIREKICLAKANIQAKREGKTMIPDESLLSYLMASSDFYGKTNSPLRFYVFEESGEKRMLQTGEVFYDQERVLAFNYKSVCNSYDIHLQTLIDKREGI